MQIGSKVEGLSRKLTNEFDYFLNGKLQEGITFDTKTKEMVPVARKIENMLSGKVKSIRPGFYFGVEVKLEDGSSEWFHKSSLTLLTNPF